MCVTTIVVIALSVIAIIVMIFLAIYIDKLGMAIKRGDYDVIKSSYEIIRAVVTALMFLVCGASAGTFLTGCSAMRSITVQGTVVQSQNSDTTRIIISSQESYRGVKK